MYLLSGWLSSILHGPQDGSREENRAPRPSLAKPFLLQEASLVIPATKAFLSPVCLPSFPTAVSCKVGAPQWTMLPSIHVLGRSHSTLLLSSAMSLVLANEILANMMEVEVWCSLAYWGLFSVERSCHAVKKPKLALCRGQVEENQSTVIPRYPQGIGSKTPANTNIQGCSNTLYKMA